MTNDLIIIRTIRTAVPAAVGALIAWLASLTPVVQDVLTWLDQATGEDVAGAIKNILTALVIVVYYVVVTWAAKRWQWVEGFLGSTKRPVDYVVHEKKGGER